MAISGQLQRDLGLVDSLPEWSQREIDIFEAVLTRDGKDMDLIASQLAPEKCVGDVVRFYFCSWKGRLLPQAQLWYERRKQVSATLCAAFCFSMSRSPGLLSATQVTRAELSA